MRILARFVIVVYSLSLARGIAQPSGLQTMSAEPLRVTLSKIAPLEQWSVDSSQFGPRVCWRFFRANPQHLKQLWRVIRDFTGHTQWQFVDDCLVAGWGLNFLAPPALATRINSNLPMSPSPGYHQLTQEQASDDLAQIARQIESSLNLKGIEPKFLTEDLLTKEGLRRSPGPFEDFQDGGQRLAYLVVRPKVTAVFEPTDADIMLHFAPLDDEITGILNDVLGVDLTIAYGRGLTEVESDKIKKEFPVFWSVSDYYEDAYLHPQDAEALLHECTALDKVVSSPLGIRGLDKLCRIAYWASSRNYGVLFSAP